MYSSGIYIITCLGNNKIYIGQSFNIKTRIRTHVVQLNRKVHHNTYLQDSWFKYGEKMFVFDVLEYCEIEKLNERETFFINELKCRAPNGFNMTDGGDGVRGLKFSAITKENWSKSRKGKYLGKEHPKHKPIIGVKISDNSKVYFDSLLCAERFLNIKGANKNISTVCNGKRKHAYGYKWMYNISQLREIPTTIVT